jgi:hypothetical protein
MQAQEMLKEWIRKEGRKKGWLAEHPLTAADLEQECEFLQAAGFRLRPQ